MKLRTKKAEEKTTRGMNSKSHKRLRIITIVLLNVLGIWCVSGNVVPCVIAFHVLFFFSLYNIPVKQVHLLLSTI